MKKKKLIIDLDNVICDSDSVVRALIKKHLHISARRQDIVSFDYWKALGYDKKSEKAIWAEFHEKSCFSATLVEHSVNALSRLSLYTDIHILTARHKSASPLTRKWVQKHRLPHHSLRLVNESEKIKTALASNNGLLVDDRGETAAAIAREGRRVILFDNPWNKRFKHKNIVRRADWPSIYSYISLFDGYAEALRALHQQLYLRAEAALENSYSPYSHYKVGAAIMTKDGKVFAGCNIENVAFSPTVCAERTAIFNAISAGYTKGDFFAISIAARNSAGAARVATPCGVCRQVMQEFSDPAFPLQISTRDSKGGVRVRALKAYLPLSFSSF